MLLYGIDKQASCFLMYKLRTCLYKRGTRLSEHRKSMPHVGALMPEVGTLVCKVRALMSEVGTIVCGVETLVSAPRTLLYGVGALMPGVEPLMCGVGASIFKPLAFMFKFRTLVYRIYTVIF
jgi:hypothetical protein